MNPNVIKSRFGALEPLIAEFTQPLQKIGVPFYSYARVYKNDTFLFLCNQPAWHQFKFENNLFDFNGFVPTLNLRPDFFTKKLFTGQPDKEIRVLPALYNAGFWNMIGYYSYTKEFIESVHFGGKREQSGAIDLYLNHPEFFEKFIYGFRYLFTDLLEPPEPNLLISLNDSFQEPIPKHINLSFTPFLKNSLPVTIQEKNFLLSARQVECLAYFLRGATAKETAQKLNLSFRTVQFYHKLLNRKFGSQNLSDILLSLSSQEISYVLAHLENCEDLPIDHQHLEDEISSILLKELA